MSREKYREPGELPLIEEYPDVFVFQDGRRVETPQDWVARREEIKELFAYYVYGPLPETEGQQVRWRLKEQRVCSRAVAMPEGNSPMLTARVMELEAIVAYRGREARFPALAVLPVEAPAHGLYPVHLEMRFVEEGKSLEAGDNAFYAASRGYATICCSPTDVAVFEIGRAVQQECRDRSRMPSSA